VNLPTMNKDKGLAYMLQYYTCHTELKTHFQNNGCEGNKSSPHTNTFKT